MVLQETRGKLLINTFVGSISDQPRKMRRRCRTRQVGRERCAGQGADCRTLEKDAIVRKIRSCGKSHAAVALQCPLTAPRHIRVPLISSAGEGVDFLGCRFSGDACPSYLASAPSFFVPHTHRKEGAAGGASATATAIPTTPDVDEHRGVHRPPLFAMPLCPPPAEQRPPTMVSGTTSGRQRCRPSSPGRTVVGVVRSATSRRSICSVPADTA